MPRYRMKPLEVEAFQLPGTDQEASAEYVERLHAFLGGTEWESGRDGALIVHTLSGAIEVQPRDWIVRGVKGEFYSVKSDIFPETHDPIAD